jgi:hypothetical protein
MQQLGKGKGEVLRVQAEPMQLNTPLMCCLFLWPCFHLMLTVNNTIYGSEANISPVILQSYKLLKADPTHKVDNEIWKAPVAASLLGGLLVLLFNFLSCAILIR